MNTTAPLQAHQIPTRWRERNGHQALCLDRDKYQCYLTVALALCREHVPTKNSPFSPEEQEYLAAHLDTTLTPEQILRALMDGLLHDLKHSAWASQLDVTLV